MLAAVTVVLVVVAAAQLLLPGLAARTLRRQLSRYGSVRAVRVEAFPAIELLFHHADRVTVTLDSLHASAARTGSLLEQSAGVGTLDVSAARLDIGLLRLRSARLHKQGDRLDATGRVSESDLRGAVPFLENVVPVAASGATLVLRGTAGALGLSATVDATVAARGGTLIVAPNLPLLAPVTLFADPHVAVQAVSGAPGPGGFVVMASGRLR